MFLHHAYRRPDKRCMGLGVSALYVFIQPIFVVEKSIDIGVVCIGKRSEDTLHRVLLEHCRICLSSGIENWGSELDPFRVCEW